MFCLRSNGISHPRSPGASCDCRTHASLFVSQEAAWLGISVGIYHCGFWNCSSALHSYGYTSDNLPPRALQSSDLIFRSADHLQQDLSTETPSTKHSGSRSLWIAACASASKPNLCQPSRAHLPSRAQLTPITAPLLFLGCAHLTIISTAESSPKLGITNISSEFKDVL